MAANNQGIVHLRLGKPGTFRPMLACKRTNAHMAVGTDQFDAEPRKCVRCESAWQKMKAIAARKQEKAAH
jgi:hypothetical protein